MTYVPEDTIRTPIRDRIPALRAELASMESKSQRLRAAITVRKDALNRLLAQAALDGANATVRSPDE